MNPKITPYGYLNISDGIVQLIYKKGVKLDLKAASDLVKERIGLTEGKTFPALIDTEGVVSIDKKARDYFGSLEAQKGISAAALVCKSFYSMVLANFFLNLTAAQRKIPARIFRNRQKALRWLEKYKKIWIVPLLSCQEISFPVNLLL
jgi:TPR repeat protein